MNLSLRLFAILLVSAVILVACSKDDDDDDISSKCGNNWNASIELEDEIDALAEASQAYAMDQSTANCEAYREAYLDYLNTIREFEECYIHVGQRQAFLDAVEQAEMDINDIEC